jgi:hypothetical protein
LFSMTWEEVFALLLTTMGPVGITMTDARGNASDRL